MEIWQITLVSIAGLALLVALVMFVWFLAILLIINMIILNLDTIFTNRPIRVVFTSAQLERSIDGTKN
jgi:hypothetical protein